MKQTSLYDMGRQYAVEADSLAQMITACRERKRFAMRGGNSAEATRQERLIELHTQQRNDLLRLSAWLRNYYDAEERETNIIQKGEAHENHHSCTA